MTKRASIGGLSVFLPILSACALSALPFPAFGDVITPSGRVIECFCTDTQGARHDIGDIICLTVDRRSFLAKCAMAENVPIWRDQKQGCVSSHLRAPVPNAPLGETIPASFAPVQNRAPAAPPPAAPL